MNMKRYKALAFGTFASPSNRGVQYINPDHADEKHHSPVLTDAEAVAARDRGLIAEDDKGVEVDDNGKEIVDETTLAHVSQQRLQDVAGETDEATGSIATLDSRQTTAWPDAGRVRGGDDGVVDAPKSPAVSTEIAGTQMGTGEDGSGGSDDDDAAPAPTARTGRTAAAKK